MHIIYNRKERDKLGARALCTVFISVISPTVPLLADKSEI